MDPLKPVTKGDSPTVLDADVANEWIKRINYVFKSRVIPDSIGEFKNSPDGPILDLSRLEEYVKNLANDAVREQIEGVTRSLDISAECNEDGTLSVTLALRD